jgi:hypothetical protein
MRRGVSITLENGWSAGASLPGPQRVPQAGGPRRIAPVNGGKAHAFWPRQFDQDSGTKSSTETFHASQISGAADDGCKPMPSMQPADDCHSHLFWPHRIKMLAMR